MRAELCGWEPSPLYFIPPRCQVREREEGRVKPPQSLNIYVFNVLGCSRNEVKKVRSVKKIEAVVGYVCS